MSRTRSNVYDVKNTGVYDGIGIDRHRRLDLGVFSASTKSSFCRRGAELP